MVVKLFRPWSLFPGLVEGSPKLTCLSKQQVVDLPMEPLEYDSRAAQNDWLKTPGADPRLETLTTNNSSTDEVDDNGPVNV